MKRLSVFVMAVFLVAGFAQALSLPDATPLIMHLHDASSLYDANGVPRDHGATPAVGDENRAVFEIDQILNGGPVWSSSSDEELTGLFYDLVLVNVDEVLAGDGVTVIGYNLDFAAGARNPLVGDVDGDSLDGAGNRLPGYGGVVEMYLDDSPDFLWSEDLPLGPGAWVEGNPGPPRVADAYPDATDGELWASGVFVPQHNLVDGTPIVFRETLDLITGSGSGHGWVNIVGGSGEANFSRGVYTTGTGFPADVQLEVSLVFPPNDSFRYADPDGTPWCWQVESSDPVRFETPYRGVPEPATLLLLGMGAVGAVGWIRRRK